MTIAFDFDDTITSDHRTMLKVMRLFRKAGHTVIVATLRHEHERAFVDRLLKEEFPVVFCGRQIKAPECRAQGYQVDVWVDDMPEYCRRALLERPDPAPLPETADSPKPVALVLDL